LSEQRKYRQFTPQQKAEIVLAGRRGARSVRDVCREYQIAETLYYQWRERLLEGGKTALANLATRRQSRPRSASSAARSGSWSGHSAVRPMSWRWRGTLAGLGVNERVARSRAVVAAGHRPAVVARVARISRQALYRRCGRRPLAAGPGPGRPDDQPIVEVAKANPTDGTRMVAALASRELGRPVELPRSGGHLGAGRGQAMAWPMVCLLSYSAGLR
jgi:transposase-like protein